MAPTATRPHLHSPKPPLPLPNALPYLRFTDGFYWTGESIYSERLLFAAIGRLPLRSIPLLLQQSIVRSRGVVSG